MSKLGDIARFQSGGTPSRKKAEYFRGEIPWISTVALNGDIIGFEDAKEFISELAITESAAKIVPANSIMVGTRVGVGKVAINNVPMSTSQDVVSLVDIDEAIWNKKYIVYSILAKTEYLNNQARGATIKGIKIDVLENIEIIDRCIDEQIKIVSIMDQLNKMIDNRNIVIDVLDVLVKSRFIEMFGDPVTNSKKLATKKGNKVFKLSNGKAVPIEKRTTCGIPAYGGNGISWYTDEALYSKDTIVVGRVGFQSGNVHYAEAPIWITDNAMYVSWYDEGSYDLKFLCAMMEYINFSKFQDMGDLKKVTQKPFMEFSYICPTLQEQRQYVDFVALTDKSKLAVQQSIETLQMLKAKLMQDYFG